MGYVRNWFFAGMMGMIAIMTWPIIKYVKSGASLWDIWWMPCLFVFSGVVVVIIALIVQKWIKE